MSILYRRPIKAQTGTKLTVKELKKMVPAKVYEYVTGKPWATARKEGLTDGEYTPNSNLKNSMIEEYSTRSTKEKKKETVNKKKETVILSSSPPKKETKSKETISRAKAYVKSTDRKPKDTETKKEARKSRREDRRSARKRTTTTPAQTTSISIAEPGISELNINRSGLEALTPGMENKRSRRIRLEEEMERKRLREIELQEIAAANDAQIQKDSEDIIERKLTKTILDDYYNPALRSDVSKLLTAYRSGGIAELLSSNAYFKEMFEVITGNTLEDLVESSDIGEDGIKRFSSSDKAFLMAQTMGSNPFSFNTNPIL